MGNDANARMSKLEHWLLWLTSAGVTGTGAVYLWMKYFMETEEPWAVINHPLQPWMLKAHILIAPLLVLILGGVLLNHVPQHLREAGRSRLASGMALLVAIGSMVLSGYLIQVITHEGWVRTMALFHIGSSFAFLAVLAFHSVRVAARGAQSRGDRDAADVRVLTLTTAGQVEQSDSDPSRR